MWLHHFQNQIHWCHRLTDERKVSCVVSVIDEQHSLEDTPCVLHWKAIIFQISVPRPHPSTTPVLMSADAPTVSGQWPIHNSEAILPFLHEGNHSFHLMSHYLLHSSWIYAFGGYLMALQSAGGKFKYDLGTHLTVTENTLWWGQNHTLPQRPVTAYNWFLSNNVQNVTFMN